MFLIFSFSFSYDLQCPKKCFVLTYRLGAEVDTADVNGISPLWIAAHEKEMPIALIPYECANHLIKHLCVVQRP